MNRADLVTLFVSADFLNSDYCYEKEMMRAMERHALERVPVVPILVRPCDCRDAPFGTLQANPWMEWLARIRAERSKVLGETQEKIDVIQGEVASGVEVRSLEAYRRWVEYIRRR